MTTHFRCPWCWAVWLGYWGTAAVGFVAPVLANSPPPSDIAVTTAARDLTGWQEPQHWPGPGVAARYNGRETVVTFENRSQLTVYLSNPLEYGPQHKRPEVVIQCWFDPDTGLDPHLVAPTPGDAVARRLSRVERDHWLYLRYELLPTRESFHQLTLRLADGATRSGSLIIAAVDLVEGSPPQADLRANSPAVSAPRAQFAPTGFPSLDVPDNPADWPARRAVIEAARAARAGLLRGGQPPANVTLESLSQTSLAGVTRHLVRVGSAEGTQRHAWLLVPQREGKSDGATAQGVPVVIVMPRQVAPHGELAGAGDELAGLSGDGRHALGWWLARAGLAAWCWTLPPQPVSDRSGQNATKSPPPRLATTPPPHDAAATMAGLVEASAQICLAADALTHPAAAGGLRHGLLDDIDTSRIGVAGTDAGGQAALLAVAADTRLMATAVAGRAVDPIARWSLTNEGRSDPAPGWLGFETQHLLALAAPRPVVMVLDPATSNPPTFAEALRDEVGVVYHRLGQPQALGLVTAGDGPTATTTMTGWLQVHLRRVPSPRDPDEPPAPPPTPKQRRP